MKTKSKVGRPKGSKNKAKRSGVKHLTQQEIVQIRQMYGKSKPSTKRIMDRDIAPLMPNKGGVFIENRAWDQKTGVRGFAAKAFPERKFRAIVKDNGTYLWREK